MLNNMRLVHYLQRIRQGKEVRLPEDQKRRGGEVIPRALRDLLYIPLLSLAN